MSSIELGFNQLINHLVELKLVIITQRLSQSTDNLEDLPRYDGFTVARGDFRCVNVAVKSDQKRHRAFDVVKCVAHSVLRCHNMADVARDWLTLFYTLAVVEMATGPLGTSDSTYPTLHIVHSLCNKLEFNA